MDLNSLVGAALDKLPKKPNGDFKSIQEVLSSILPTFDPNVAQQRRTDLAQGLQTNIGRPILFGINGTVAPLDNALNNATHGQPIFPPFQNQQTEQDYQKELPAFAPSAKYFLGSFPRDQIESQMKDQFASHPIKFNDFGPDGRLEGGRDTINLRQALILKAMEGSGGLDTKAFYKDLNALSPKYSPYAMLWDHAAHTAEHGYPDLSPDERAKQIYAHIGAVFGTQLFGTPIGKYYQGILQPSDEYAFSHPYVGQQVRDMPSSTNDKVTDGPLDFPPKPSEHTHQETGDLPAGHNHSAHDYNSVVQHYNYLLNGGWGYTPQSAWLEALHVHGIIPTQDNTQPPNQ